MKKLSLLRIGNNLSIVPEPSSFALLAGPVLLGAWFFVRRRRQA